MRSRPICTHDTTRNRTRSWSRSDIEAAVAGRIMLKRLMGKASFATIQDMSERIQLYVTADAVGPDVYDAFKRWDLGRPGRRRRSRLQDPHRRALAQGDVAAAPRQGAAARCRKNSTGSRIRSSATGQRYVDLITNPASREVFKRRSQIVQAIREFFVARGYLEVETPMMHSIPGGAAARPFRTHHNALDMELFLRIAPELYLKRLVVGGLEKVFEINRNFRNEGISTRHNPEFTMLEFYEAYQDYRYLMDLTETLIAKWRRKVLGTQTVTYQGVAIDLSKPFDRLTMAEAVHKYNPEVRARRAVEARST
jgi:lysyl-tRNA synthetase class 2